jgi:hypothetical protein
VERELGRENSRRRPQRLLSKGALECMRFIWAALPHAVRLLQGKKEEDGQMA